jgi:Inorganic Pyrophosphatase
VTLEQADTLAPARSGRWRIVHNGDGTLSTIQWNTNSNSWGVAKSQKNIPHTTTPEKGLIPLELWKHEKIHGRDAYSSLHFGNEITEIRNGKPMGTAADPFPIKSAEDMDIATSVMDGDHTGAQGEAGNAKRAHIVFTGHLEGLPPVTLEAEEGGTRRGLTKEGKEWTQRMGSAYGYFKGGHPDGDGQAPRTASP